LVVGCIVRVVVDNWNCNGNVRSVTKREKEKKNQSFGEGDDNKLKTLSLS